MKKKNLKILLVVLVLILIIIVAFVYFKTDFFKSYSYPINGGEVPVNQEEYSPEEQNLLDLGYSKEEVNEILTHISEKNREKISSYEDLSPFYDLANFQMEYLDRYKAYHEIEHLEWKDIVTRVNLHLDEAFYSEIEEIKDPSSLTVLVNKYHALPANYEPEDLIAIPSFPNLKLREEAAYALEELIAAAKENQSILIPYSTYRSYDYQDGLYSKYLQSDPIEVVDTYSARPGHSEHQTGLAVDIRSQEHWSNLTDRDYEWMKENSYLYGFIIRYTKDNMAITGYKEEPWHIRYIGKEHATKVHELGITYDEYYDLYLQEY